MTRSIDIHAHVLPTLFSTAADRGTTRWGIEFGRADDGRMMFQVAGRWQPALQGDVYGETPAERVARMRRVKVDVQVLSLSPSLFLYLEDPADAAGFSVDVNDAIGAIVSAEPEHFRGLAVLPLEHPKAAAAELERTMALDGFVGAVVSTNVNGRDWDDPYLEPILEAAEGLGALVFVHPSSVRAGHLLDRHHLRNLIGNPLETTIAIASLVFGGVLDRFPSLELCLAHGGGYAGFGIGRFDYGSRVRPEARSVRLPSEYLRRLWFDSLTHDETALRYLIDKVGPDRILLGSDDPADMGLTHPVDWIEGCSSLTERERLLILGENAIKLLGDSLPDAPGG
jgi:aminocarboxymuconate-semialdehyde decarboxylase